jgi:hypothetical protein
MKLRQKSKRDQALDALASIARTWSEWRLGDKVSKTAGTASKKASKHTAKASKHARKHAEKASKQAKRQAAKASLPDVAKRKPVRIAGAVALVGGIGAAVAKKLTGGKAEPLYTPPGPAPDMPPPPPSPVAVEDLASDTSAGDKPDVPPTVEPARTASTDVPPRDPSPVVVEDLASDASGEPEPGSEDARAEAANGAGETEADDVVSELAAGGPSDEDESNDTPK